MKNKLPKIILLGCLGALVLLFGMGFLGHETPGMIDWRSMRAVAFESDDWGLAGFVPSADVWDGIPKEDLTPGRFPEVYWHSTLEDSLMVADLCEIMGEAIGADGLPAVFQPNYIMSSLNYEESSEGFVWKRYNLPDFPPQYSRPGMWSAVEKGIGDGVWYPEFHATWHYDPDMRLASALSGELARKMTIAGVMLFPESEKARELGPWRTREDLQHELSMSRELFQLNFHRPIGSIIAPDYTWNRSVEDMWLKQGIRVIQAKREQRDPTLLPGKVGRIQKYLNRKFNLLFTRNRLYLVRNCRLEPAQAPDASAVVHNCLADTRKAWKSGQPAIVETHRVNFAHFDPDVVELGQTALKGYLDSLSQDDSHLPVYLVDTEIAQLQIHGVSWVSRGDQLVLRNATHSRRLITVDHGSGSQANISRQFILNPHSVIVTKW
jgi:hypothetical protein